MTFTDSKQLDEQLSTFVNRIKERCGANLQSVVLYGGVAKNDYSEGKSNVNLLFVFETVDLEVLDQLALLFQQGMAEFRLSPFILTASEIEPSSDVFAVKLFDIKKHSRLLYGRDCLAQLEFDNKHLKFISEQELRNQLSRMKFFYIQNFNLPENLLQKVQKGFTTLLINANTFLYLKQGLYLATRREITERLLQEPGMDQQILKSLLSIKDEKSILSPELIRKAYNDLMIAFKELVKLFKQLHTNG